MDYLEAYKLFKQLAQQCASNSISTEQAAKILNKKLNEN